MSDTAVPPQRKNARAMRTIASPRIRRAATDEPAPQIVETHVARQPREVRWAKRLARSITITDLCVVMLTVGVAFVLRFGLSSDEFRSQRSSLMYPFVGFGIVALWMIALAGGRTRDRRIVGIGPAEYQRVVNATLLTFGLVTVFAFLTKLDVARGYLLVALPLGLTLLLLSRLLWRRALHSMRRAGRCLTGAIIVGPREDVAAAVDRLRHTLQAGYKPIGVVLTDAALTDAALTDGEPGGSDDCGSVPRISLHELVDIAKRTHTHAVIITGNLPGGREQIRDISWSLENSKTELILVSSLTDVSGPRIHWRPVDGLPMVHVDLPQYSGVNHVVKRIVDLVLASIMFVLLSPILIAAAIAVRLGSSGPVIFKQERVGVNGTRFTMYKFRSMVTDAEEQLAALHDQDQGNGVQFKLHNDPRVTPVGRFMRRYSIDELPQLVNVITGDMSLVGPRPPLPIEVEQYGGRVHRRLLIKPGITGPWQINGRSDLSWEESVKLDLYYVENWSITGDLLILVRTLRAVFRRVGAY
jgi:exopolysaccharide biosynthesis polyprenyl glycosylphosphotransferase